MTSKPNEKRLATVEAELTPKEWAVRLADEIRKHPSEADFVRAVEKVKRDSPFVKPFKALADHAKERHRGSSNDAINARAKLQNTLQNEYKALSWLILDVNTAIRSEAEVAGLKAAVKLMTLEKTVLLDAFGRTARKVAEWVEEYKTADKDDEENRQIMLAELSAYTDFDYGERWSDSIPLTPDVRIRFPSAIEDWVADTAGLIVDVFAHRDAVGIIQDKHFDSHPILFQDAEVGLNGVIKTLESGLETFGAYLQTRETLFKAEWEEDEEENDGIAGAIPGEREGKLAIDVNALRPVAAEKAKGIAKEWVKDTKMKVRAMKP